jgi:hypothetical protein
MLFGTNPWTGGGARAPRRQQPPQVAQPLAQPQQQAPQYPAPTWPGQTPDGAYALGLAQNYASQLQNQQVPGSIVPQMMPPQGIPAPVAQQPGMQPNWRDAFRSALMDWRDQRGTMGRADWRALRPDRQAFRMGSY